MAKRENPRRTRRTADEWRELLAEQSRSGLTQSAFCSQRAMNVSTFSKARQRFSGAGSASRRLAPDFVAVATTAHDAGAWELELEVGQRIVIRLKGL